MSRIKLLLSISILSGPLVAGCSNESSAPATVQLNGTWHVGYTASESAFVCTYHDVLLVFDSTAVSPGFMYGGTGTCVGRGRNDTLTQATSSIDSLTMGAGRIRFRIFANSWLFDGRIVSLDSLTGTLTEDGSYTGIGSIHLVGPWGAKRASP